MYHVMNRGVERRVIFSDTADHQTFVDLIHKLSGPSDVEIHAYCLMPNHDHLVLKAPGGDIRRFMREVNGRYAQFYNRKYRRVGPLFQGRYRALLVAADQRLLAVVRYVHHNPVVAGLEETAAAWRWSSRSAYQAGTEHAWVKTGLVLGIIDDDRPIAIRTFDRFSEEGGAEDPARDAVARAILGS